MRMILVRHGETGYNADHRLTGQQNPSLTSQGKQQALAVADRLQHVSIEGMYCSTLTRARETADIIAANRELNIEEHAWLQERHAGVLQGLTKMEMKQRYRQEHRAYKSADLHEAIPGGGESNGTFHQRITKGLELLVAKHHEQTILLVTHTGVLREIFNMVFNTRQNGNHLRSANGAICSFIYEKGLWSLETWGDVAHLTDVGTNIEAF